MTMLLERVGRSIDAITDKVVIRRPTPKPLKSSNECAHSEQCPPGEVCIPLVGGLGICTPLEK
jgi:hypothetical protein